MAATERATGLLDMSPDVMSRVLLQLRPRELANVSLTCRRLRVAASDDARVWAPLCTAAWAAVTTPSAWLQNAPVVLGASPPVGSAGSASRVPWGSWGSPLSASMEEDDEVDTPPCSYRAVYALLYRLQPFVGLWKGVGDAPRGSLFRIAWAPDHLSITQLRPTSTHTHPQHRDRAPEPPFGAAAAGAAPAAAADEADDDDDEDRGVPFGSGAAVREELAPDPSSLLHIGPGFPGLELQLVDEVSGLAVVKRAGGARGLGHGADGLGASEAAVAAAEVAAGAHAFLQRDGGGGSLGSGGGPGGGGVLTGLLGASPPKGSFGHEMLRFMAASVAGSRSSAKKNRNRGSRAAGGGGSGGSGSGGCRPGVQPPHHIMHHLMRLRPPPSTRQRPLAGVWTGKYGTHGLEAVSVSYEGPRIMATKLTGDPNVPAGQTTFWAASTPLPHPWPQRETDLVARRPWFLGEPGAMIQGLLQQLVLEDEVEVHVNQPAVGAGAGAQEAAVGVGGIAAAAAVAVQVAAAVAQEQGPVDLWAIAGQPALPAAPVGRMARSGSGPVLGAGQGAGQGGGARGAGQGSSPGPVAAGQADGTSPAGAGGGAGGSAGGAGAQAQRRGPPRVVAIFEGKGRIAGPGFSNPAWIEGRLWVYDNGCIGFLWLGEFEFLVDFTRLSPSLLAS